MRISHRACASANEAIASIALQIGAGLCEVGIAGGAESVSDVPVLHSRRMARMLVEASRARSLGGRLRGYPVTSPTFRRLHPEDVP